MQMPISLQPNHAVHGKFSFYITIALLACLPNRFLLSLPEWADKRRLSAREREREKEMIRFWYISTSLKHTSHPCMHFQVRRGFWCDLILLICTTIAWKFHIIRNHHVKCIKRDQAFAFGSLSRALSHPAHSLYSNWLRLFVWWLRLKPMIKCKLYAQMDFHWLTVNLCTLCVCVRVPGITMEISWASELNVFLHRINSRLAIQGSHQHQSSISRPFAFAIPCFDYLNAFDFENLRVLCQMLFFAIYNVFIWFFFVRKN